MVVLGVPTWPKTLADLTKSVPSKSLNLSKKKRFPRNLCSCFSGKPTILYNIDHPQIPKFQAIFEEEHRLFLVQDYVEGTTYRDLLNQRVAKGMTFSEAEVRQFLQQMLPVLAHIHSKGIIHRGHQPRQHHSAGQRQSACAD